jgi:hypothetical protein
MVKSTEPRRTDVPPAPEFVSFFLAARAITAADPDVARWENEGGACLPSGLASKLGFNPK